ncbi:MAG: PAS domain S-box protein [Methanoregula sp.]|jgi:PAS domain S-box-containing protein
MIGETEEVRAIREILKKNPRGMSITDISRELNLNRNSVAKYVNMLLVAGQAEMKNHAAAKVYFLSQRVPLSAMLDFSTDAIVIVNPELAIIQANDNFLSLSGISREDLDGASLESLKVPVFENRKLISLVQDAIRGIGTDRTLTWHTKDESRFLQIKLIPTVFEDGSAALTIILEDITRQVLAQQALEKSETLYRAIVEDQTELVCRFGPDHLLTFVNLACSRYAGADKSALIGRNILEFIPEEDQGHTLESLKTLNPASPTMTIENRIIGQNNSLRWMQWGIRALFRQDGKAIEYQVVGRDITDLKESTEAVHRLLKKKDELLCEIKYRTRSNLHFMASLIDLQALSRSDPACLEVLREEKNQIMALARIYEEITRSDDLTCIPVLHYLEKLGADLYDTYHIDPDRVLLGITADSIVLDINTAIPVGLIFNELVSNSLKYAFPDNRSGHVEVHIQQDNTSTSFTVKDDGIGLPAEFDPDRISTVGLELVSILCRQIHGTMTCSGKCGTEVSIRFPSPKPSP